MEKLGAPPPPESKPQKRASWISSLSSRFSSAQSAPSQPATTLAQAQASPATHNGPHGATSSMHAAANNGGQATNGAHGGLEPYVPQPPKSSFISNALRRFSSGTQMAPTASGKAMRPGGVCPRKVMNVNRSRQRCRVPELDQHKLRRVAFCVDVEIAGGPRCMDAENQREEKKRSKDDKKLKERSEGEALKNPRAVADEKDKEDMQLWGSPVRLDGPAPTSPAPGSDPKDLGKKKDKKKKSEVERSEHKERKRRKAEENGSIPLELSWDGDLSSTPSLSGSSTPRPQDRPTTDPLRIYRRCCQLRETPILKRITEQLAAPSACAVATPGMVSILDLTGSRLQLADVATLGDWLAVVPVKKLVLEDADLTDEKLRIVLAGLLAAKAPRSSRRRGSSQSTDMIETQGYGVVEKLCLKNNAKITRDGWRHICLFIYMCKTVKALDVSMVSFPQSVPQIPPKQDASDGTATSPVDIAETFFRAVSQRLGGSRLEELNMSECALTSADIKKIVDGVIGSRTQRLGLASNNLDDDGLNHVIRFLESGICQGLDLGGNDLQAGIGRLAESLDVHCTIWALCLADSNLTPQSLKMLLPALTGLPNFRFLDLSHNRDLFLGSLSLCILRKYLPQLRQLRRIHLVDVSLSPEQTIGLAEVLPECPHLAHLNILENPQVTALSTAADEASQEEACAVYASLMAATRVSHTLICIDVDVPSQDTSEVVQALAKQVVAYCLRNMENLGEVPELRDKLHKEVEVPDVLLHLVGHVEGSSPNADDDEPASRADYIVGGAGVVKALSYCLLQKASDLRRTSLSASGTVTPRVDVSQPTSSKAKHMSKNLLGSARNIRARLQPALVRQAGAGDDMAYRE